MEHMTTTDNLIELIGQSVNVMLEVRYVSSIIADERDSLRAENERLKAYIDEHKLREQDDVYHRLRKALLSSSRLRKALREVTDALAAYGFSSSPSDPVMKAREVLKDES